MDALRIQAHSTCFCALRNRHRQVMRFIKHWLGSHSRPDLCIWAVHSSVPFFRIGIIIEAIQTVTPSAVARKGPRDIVDMAIAAGNLTTFIAALQAADLVTTLKGAGPFTVFAPTDDAFNKLPAGMVEELLKDKAKLAGILSYHVITTKLLSKDVRSTDNTTLQGTTIKVVSANGGVNVNDARVTKADIEATNGLIHAIDTVLMPK
jgi:uncharacterized surface protein with fasciclin (FAS1) repeats